MKEESAKLMSLLKFYKKENQKIKLRSNGNLITGKVKQVSLLNFNPTVILELDKGIIKLFINDIDKKSVIPSSIEYGRKEKPYREAVLRSSIPKKLRYQVFNRDNHLCQDCGRGSPEVKLEIDHIIPISQGGRDELSNLQTLCFDCNRSKSDK